ncbi:electron transport complex subunit RsxG [Psychromonas sp. CD1]|uniref:electron transport complex subunit RsxG n=1 Tax=Psychromonas sp. CD1 TaxID=1979839 RepID=UPI000B9A8202|nr:electron transport complex subunit RsxG [Psychromonas sp. CD1]
MSSIIYRNAFLLATFAIICTGAVALINQITQPIIAEQEEKALLSTIDQLIPASLYDNNIIQSCFIIQDDKLLGKGVQQKVFVAKKDKLPVALMLESSTFKGYSGEIKLAIGIFENGTLAGVNVLHDNETPGLGDKIQTKKSNWITVFKGKTYQPSEDKRWEVKKHGGDIDAFTGATISPRAVTLAVRDALIYFQKHRDFLFNQPANCGEK